MQAASLKSSDKTSAEPARQPKNQVGVQRDVGPLWSGMATHITGSVAAVSSSDNRDAGAHRIPKSPARQALVQRLCTECEQDQQNEPAAIQPRLTIGAPSDPYEQEADAVANTVLHSTLATGSKDDQVQPLQARPISLVQRLCTACDQANEPNVQTSTDQDRPQNRLHSVQDLLSAPGAGAALPDKARSRIEPVVGADLSRVRIHDDPRSHEAAAEIQAEAFTHSNNIYLGRGQSSDNLGLIAHEATHTVQQGASPLRAPTRNPETEDSDRVEESTDDSSLLQDDETGGEIILPDAESGPIAEQQEDPATDTPVESTTQAEPEETVTQQTQVFGNNDAGQQMQAEPAGQQPASEAAGQEAQLAETDRSQHKDNADRTGQHPGEEKQQEESESDPLSTDQAAPGSETHRYVRPAIESVRNIGSAPDSRMRSHVVLQAQLVMLESHRSQMKLERLAEQRRQQVRVKFQTIRDGIMDTVTNAISTAQAIITAQQLSIIAIITNTIVSAQSAITSAIQMVQTLAVKITNTLNKIVNKVTRKVQSAVRGVGRKIRNLVNSIPLPDIPGIGLARRLVNGVINRVTGAINSALGVARRAIQAFLRLGLRLVNTMLGAVSTVLNRVLNLLRRALTRLMQMLFKALNALLSLVQRVLLGVLNVTIIPLLIGIEQRVLRAITELERSAIARIRENRDAHLQALADSLTGSPDGAGTNALGDCADSEAEWMDSITEITARAKQINQKIIDDFIDSTTGFWSLLVTTLRSILMQVIQGVFAFVTWVYNMLAKLIQAALNLIYTWVVLVLTVIHSLIMFAITLFTAIWDWMVSWGNVDIGARLEEFATQALDRMEQALKDFVNAVISGGALVIPFMVPLFDNPLPDPPTTPAPPKEPSPPPDLDPSLPGVDWEVIIIIVIAIGVALLIFALILFLLWLLWKWLTRPRPPIPEPEPKPCKLESTALVPAPAGSPDDRKIVGVNEDVAVLCSEPAAFAATCGDISPTGTNSIVWSAPNVTSVCVITATPGSGCACSITMEVIPPNRFDLSAGVPSVYDECLSGSGFVATLTILPNSVSFTNIEVQEQEIDSTADGYYKDVLNLDGITHPLGNWLPVGLDNNGLNDTVGAIPPGARGPFSNGSFRWPIPQHYRKAGTTDAGIEYDTGLHAQDMADNSGTETTSKSGESNTRTPLRCVMEDPLTVETAKTVPEVRDRLDDPQHNTTAVTLTNGNSATAGAGMSTEFLTQFATGGGPPAGQTEIYGFTNLPTLRAHKDRANPGDPARGFTSSQVYIRGHLLNENFGGVGAPLNLFPITGRANKDHELDVENEIKRLLGLNLVVNYSVTSGIDSGPTVIDVQGDGSCIYEFLDAHFSCSFSTYKLFNDGTVEPNDATTPQIDSTFDEPGFKTSVNNKGCFEKDN